MHFICRSFSFYQGVVFKEQFGSVWNLIKKSFKTILLPYFLFAAFTYLFWFLKEPTTHNTLQDFIYQVQGILYGSGNNGYLYFNVALWFLPCLFITKIGFALLTKVTNDTKALLFALLGLSFIGYELAEFYLLAKLPFGIETAFSAIVFFGAGFLMKRNAHVFAAMKNKGFLIFAVGLVLTVVLATVNYNIFGLQIDMRLNRINNYFLFYGAAFAGILSWVAFSMIINKNRILEYIGKHTLYLFAWHYLLFSYLKDITAVLTIATDKAITSQFLLPTTFTIIAVIIILAGIRIFRKVKYRAMFSVTKT